MTPTEPGYYWVKLYSDEKDWSVAQLAHGRFYLCGSDVAFKLQELWQWRGPIQPPEENVIKDSDLVHCGCEVVIPQDADGRPCLPKIGDKILKACPLHAHAGEMLEMLKRMALAWDAEDPWGYSDELADLIGRVSGEKP